MCQSYSKPNVGRFLRHGVHTVTLICGALEEHFLIIYIFGGYCPMTEFCHVQNSLSIQVPILAALLHGTAAAGVSQTLRRGTRNGITELSQRAPPIFGWAAITLGIGPHSICFASLNFTVDNRWYNRRGWWAGRHAHACEIWALVLHFE